MERNRTARAAVLALLVSVIALPSAPQAQSLADAMVSAVKSSTELEQARGRVKIAAEGAVQARSRGRIQIDGSASLTTQFLQLETFAYPTTMQLNIAQPLYTGGQVANATEAARTRMSAQEAIVVATEQQVLLGAVLAYMDVQRDETLVDLSENNVRVISEQLRAARERFDVGEVTRTDVAQAEARLAAAQSLLAARRGAREAASEVFRRIVGSYPDELQPPPPIPDLPNSREEALSVAMISDPELLAARLDRQAAGSDVRAAIGALLPQISLLGRVSRSDLLDVRGSGDTQATVGLQVTIPFYDGGYSYSRVREAQAAVEIEEAGISGSMREIAEAVGTSWADLQVAKASIEAGELEVRAAQIAFEGVREEAEVGARTTLDVLDAEQELLSARGDLIVARRDLVVAAYSLLFSIGKLTVEHLGLDLGDVPPATDYYASVKDRNFGYDATDETVWALSYRP